LEDEEGKKRYVHGENTNNGDQSTISDYDASPSPTVDNRWVKSFCIVIFYYILLEILLKTKSKRFKHDKMVDRTGIQSDLKTKILIVRLGWASPQESWAQPQA